MKAKDIVNQLALVLPTQVDDFTTQISVTGITRSGTTATATTATAHGLTAGKQVNINGAKTPIVITDIDRVGIVATLTTDTNHDMTENAGFDVQISGATESEFNGTFELISVPNRRTVSFMVDDSGPISATGSPLLLNGSNIYATYNGLREVTAVPTTTTFEFPVTDGIFTPASGTIIAKTGPRVSSAVTFDRLLEAYTKQNPDEGWVFVVLGDAVASKNRNIDTDSTDNLQIGNYFNQRIIQAVNIYVFLPTTSEIAGTVARDRCEELLKPICNSILGFRFPSLVENSNNPLMLTGHGLQAYSTAFYAHQYVYESTIQLGQSDVFVPSDDVAFRCIDMTMGLDVGTETFNTLIDLDDQPYEAAAPPSGTYSSSFGTPSALDDANVRGGLIRIKWNTVEAVEGVYDFSAIDAEREEIISRGLEWSLAIIAGGDTPDWMIDDLGVDFFEITTPSLEVKRVPKMWDSSIPNDKLRLLLFALAEKYGSDDTLHLVYLPQYTVNGIEGHFNGVSDVDLLSYGFTADAWVDGTIENCRNISDAFSSKSSAVELHYILSTTVIPDRIIDELAEDSTLINVGIASWWLSGKTSYQPDLITSMTAFTGNKYSQVIARSDQTTRFENDDYTTIFPQAMGIGFRYIEAWEYEFTNNTFPTEFANFNAWADANF